MGIKVMALLIACLLCAGCATISTLEYRADKSSDLQIEKQCAQYEDFGITQQLVYSGARKDLSNIVSLWTCSGEACWALPLFYPFILPLALADLPLSTIADTLLLPTTYNIQNNICPKTNLTELRNKRELLKERARLYYSAPSNPENIWLLSSDNFKRKMTKEQFILYLNEHKEMFKTTEDKYRYTPEVELLIGDIAIVRWWNIRGSIFDQWVYERDNWYLNELNRKNKAQITESNQPIFFRSDNN